MEQIAVTSLSSKGQVVIPREMREDLHEGEQFVVIKSRDQIILKKAGAVYKNLKEDLEFARRTEEALKKYEKGEFVEMDFNEFLEQAKKW